MPCSDGHYGLEEFFTKFLLWNGFLIWFPIRIPFLGSFYLYSLPPNSLFSLHFFSSFGPQIKLSELVAIENKNDYTHTNTHTSTHSNYKLLPSDSPHQLLHLTCMNIFLAWTIFGLYHLNNNIYSFGKDGCALSGQAIMFSLENAWRKIEFFNIQTSPLKQWQPSNYSWESAVCSDLFNIIF